MKAVEVNTVSLLRGIGWATSNMEARRMIESKGLRIDNEVVEDEEFFFAGSEFIMRFGKRRYIRIIFPAMKEFYNDSAEEEWYRI